MSSAQLVNVFRRYRELGHEISRCETPQQVRMAVDRQLGGFPSSDDVTCERVDAKGVSAHWITPKTDVDCTILYLHGGGYVVGSLLSHRELVARLSLVAKARCLFLEYRLAPEHPYPGAVEDSKAAYRWLLEKGWSANEIALVGDSAGGGLAIATLVAIRDAGLPMPSAAVCISPWVDLSLSGDSLTSRAAMDPMVSGEFLSMLRNLYIGDKDPRALPLASPLFAELKNLPPLLIQVGDAETLLDDARRLGDRAKAANVDVTLEIWPEMPHVWHCFAPILPEAQEAIARAGQFVRAQAR